MQNQKLPYILQILLFLLLPVLTQANPFLGSGILDTIEGLLGASNSSLAAGLTAFLGDHGSVIFQNGLMDEKTNRTTTNCPRMAVIFARGTNEPGNVGILTGPPFFAAIAEYMNGTNQLAIQGVNYEAQPAGFFAGGSARGATMMTTLINSTLATCPSTPLLLSGYSQGAQLIHLATSSLPSNTTSKIASIVLFGDPNNGTAIQGVESTRVRTFCHAGDDICKGGDAVLKDHLTYAKDARTAAMWAMGSVAELGISSMTMDGGIGG